MWLINNILNKIFDLFFFPFRSLNPLWGLCVISLLTGVVMLIIFRYTSNQEGIKEAKNKIKAYLFEIRLYKDDMGLTFQAQKNLLKHNFIYMKYSVIPMLIMMIPVVLVLVQLNFRFGYSPLKPGDHAIVALNLSKEIKAKDLNVRILPPEGIEVETPSLRIEQTKEIDWRIKAKEYGTFDLEFQVAGEKFNKRINVEKNLTMVSPKRVSSGISEILLNPAESPLPHNGTIESIDVKYPPMKLMVFGYNIHWLIIFFVLSIAFAFSVKGVFGVQV